MTAEGTETCAACGAARPALARACPYCGAEAKPAAVPDDAAGLQAMVAALEERLKKAKSGNDGVIALALLMIVGGTIGSWVLYRALGFGAVGTIASVVLTSFGLLIAWGGWIGVLEKRSINRCYQTSVRPTIDDFVRARAMTRHDFDATVSKLVAPESLLRPFLFGGEREL